MDAEWKAIATAPFDDTEILVLLNAKFPRVAYHYHDCTGDHVSPVDNVWSNHYDGYATHWMPILSLPIANLKEK